MLAPVPGFRRGVLCELRRGFSKADGLWCCYYRRLGSAVSAVAGHSGGQATGVSRPNVLRGLRRGEGGGRRESERVGGAERGGEGGSCQIAGRDDLMTQVWSS